MTQMLDVSEFVVASWRLAGGPRELPASHGILDRALKDAVRHESCPQWVRQSLHFAEARTGLLCVELPDLIQWAQRALLIGASIPFCQSLEIQISKGVARKVISDLNVSEEDAVSWGKLLRSLVGGG